MQSQRTTIDELVDTYYVSIYRLTLSFLKNERDAEDATQEIFIIVQRKLAGYRGDAALKTWLYSIAINYCRRRFRRKRLQQTVLSVLDRVVSAESDAYPEQSTMRNEQNKQLIAAIDTLPDKHKIPLLLRYVHELSGREIAEIMRISEGTVYSRLHYAQKKLRAILDPDSLTEQER